MLSLRALRCPEHHTALVVSSDPPRVIQRLLAIG